MLCLGNAWIDFSVDKTKTTGLYRYIYDFSVDYVNFGVNDILDFHEFLMKVYDTKLFLDYLGNCILQY